MIHVHAPPATGMKISREHCPTCQKRRYMLVATYEWYGPNIVCLKCGERWNEEGRVERPFCRSWRQMSIDSAKKWYRRWKDKQ